MHIYCTYVHTVFTRGKLISAIFAMTDEWTRGLHHTTPHHTTSHHTTSHHITPHHTTPHTTPHHITPHHITPHHTTPHHTTPHHTTSHYTTSHHTMPHHTTPHHTCLMAVRKPFGLKNPVIQNTLGLPPKTQLRNCVSLSRSSVYQKPIVEESQLIFCHNFGTRASYIESSVSLKF